MSQQQLELPKGWSNSQLEDCVDILDGKIINFAIEFHAVADPEFNKSLVLANP